MDARAKCCCCCLLRTGVIVLGVLSLIFGFTILVVCSIAIDDMNSYCDHAWSVGQYDCDSYWFYVTSLIQSLIYVGAAILLLIGIHMMRPSYLLPYLILMIINTVISLVIGIWLVAGWNKYGEGPRAIVILIGVMMSCYFINVVRLYRMQMIHQLAHGVATNMIGVVVQPMSAYPAPGVYPAQGGAFPQQPGMAFPQQPGMAFPQQPGMAFPQQPGMAPQQPGMAFPQQPGMAFPQQPGMAPQQPGMGYAQPPPSYYDQSGNNKM